MLQLGKSILNNQLRRSISTGNKFVKIVEVGPRDGLQNEPKMIDTATKLNLIKELINAGLSVVEAGAFVSSKWVSQMADTPKIYQRIKDCERGHFPALCPNLKGLESAISCGVKEIAVFGAASESFSKKNINCSIGESLERFEKVIKVALLNNIKVRG
jgi:hydroxymethylglutaryl-CoA lyase